jgi:hypothetical protein
VNAINTDNKNANKYVNNTISNVGFSMLAYKDKNSCIRKKGLIQKPVCRQAGSKFKNSKILGVYDYKNKVSGCPIPKG